MPEKPRGRSPGRNPEYVVVPLPDYRHAVKFPDEKSSNTGYEQTREVVYRSPYDLSLYRTAMLPDLVWFVLVLGEIPDEQVQGEIYKNLEGGEAVELPEDVWRTFNQRRLENSGRGPWVERRLRGRRLR